MVSTLIPPDDLAPSVTSRVLVVKAIDFTEGAPATGSITFALPWDVHVKADGLIIQAGSKTLTFDEAGEIKIRVPTADPDTDPTAWYLTVKLSWAPHLFKVRVPVGTTPINLVDVPIVQEVPAGTAPGVLLTGASATVKIGAAPDVKTTVAAGVANFDFTLPDYGPELAKVEVERIAAQAAKTEAQTAATASGASAQQSAGSAAAAAASAAQAAAPTDTVVSTLLTTPTSLARRALDSAVADKRNVVPTAITAGVNADLLRAPDTYHFRTDAIAAASTGLPVPLAGFLDVTASARARRNSLYNSGPRSAVVTGWGFQAGTGEVVSGPTTPTTPNAAPEGRTGFISRSVTTQRSSGSSGWFYRAAAGEVVGGVGDVRTLSMWVKYSHAVSVQLSAQLRPSPAAAGPSVLGPIVVVPANTWTRLSVTTTATAVYDGCQIWAVVQSNTPVPVGGTYDAADAQAELSPVLTPYFDGSMAATSSELYSYEGAAYASASLASGFITREYRTLTGRRFTQQLTAAGWSSWGEPATAAQISTAIAGLDTVFVKPAQMSSAIAALDNVFVKPAAMTAALNTATDLLTLGAPGVKYRIVAGSVRNDGTWALISDASHTPVGVDAVSADGNFLYIDYTSLGAKKVISFMAGPDETLAKLGLSVGASVGLTRTSLAMSMSHRYADYVTYNGSAWVSANGVFTPTFRTDIGQLSLKHQAFPVPDAATPFWDIHVTGRGDNLPSADGGAKDEVRVRFHSYAGAVLTAPATTMKAFVSHGMSGPVDPQGVTTALYPNSNLWFVGIFSV